MLTRWCCDGAMLAQDVTCLPRACGISRLASNKQKGRQNFTGLLGGCKLQNCDVVRDYFDSMRIAPELVRSSSTGPPEPTLPCKSRGLIVPCMVIGNAV